VIRLLKFFDEYGFYAFCLVALMLALVQPNSTESSQNTVKPYLGVVAITIILSSVARNSLIELAGLKSSKVTSRLILMILPVMLLFSCFGFWIKTALPEYHFVVRPFSFMFLINQIFFAGTRTFVEELIFRGFLLLPFFSANAKAFWGANLAQAILFTGIHAMIPMPLLIKLLFILFLFCMSVYLGWVNRKFKSLMPSWILHWTDGILSVWFFTSAA